MEVDQLLFWKSGPAVKLSSAEVALELMLGEDVEGLIDLPIREIIDRLKNEFSQNDERPGLLVVHAGGGSFDATWTWQHVKVDCRALAPADRERLIDTIESFGCMAYAPKNDE
jgi:hypothetical protein